MTGNIAPISVVIPAHNAESFIEEAISSVYAQTFKVAEIIVVVDSCSDRTPQIASEMGATVLEQNRRNIAAALNLGIGAASEPWVAFLDADDIWDKEKIALQWKAIQTCSDVGLIACDCSSLVDGEVHDFERHPDQRWNNLPNRIATEHCQYISKVDAEFFKRFYLQTSRVIFRHDVVSKVGLLDESFIYWQTIEFFTRVLRDYPLAFVERPLVYQRLHSANHTRNSEGYWTAYVSMTGRMLKNPDLYPEGAGEAYRECLKRNFHYTERELARSRARTPNLSNDSHPSKPNQP